LAFINNGGTTRPTGGKRILGARVTHGYHGVNRQILRNHMDTQGGCKDVGVVFANVLTLEGNFRSQLEIVDGTSCR
jgi:hypothetical protein